MKAFIIILAAIAILIIVGAIIGYGIKKTVEEVDYTIDSKDYID